MPSTASDGDGGRGHYIEDAGYPAFAAWIAETDKGLGTLARAFQFGYRRAVEDMTDPATPRSVVTWPRCSGRAR